ncbi:MAG: hypothetical protein MJ105_01100 [Lachnospiraceae bacterium]|nr:hypothetical protein [Lachnospiraceae bacterium]
MTDGIIDNMNDFVFDDVIVYDNTWAKMLKNAMRKVKTPYVSLWMDDYLLCDYINNQDIEKVLWYAKRYNAANIKLVNNAWDEEKKIKENVAMCKKSRAYSLSLQIGVWDARILYSFIVDEWSAWDFERKGSLISGKIKQPLLTMTKYTFPYEEGVRTGKWMDAGVKLLRRHGYDVRKTGRPIMSNFDMAKVYFKGAILDINPSMVQKLQNIYNKIIGK